MTQRIGERCRAKDPSVCRAHGRKQLGLRAEFFLNQALDNPRRRYKYNAQQRLTMPLKEMTTAGLALTIHEYAVATDGIDAEKIDSAMRVAAFLHRKHYRANRGPYRYTPYIEHPLRNTLRLARYGCRDEATLIGGIFHDTVEDSPFEFARTYAGVTTKDVHEAREASYAYIAEHYGVNAALTVRGMSSPAGIDELETEAKNRAYVEHVREAIEDPRVAVDKICDLVDNALSLHHTIPGMKPESIRKKAVKYGQVWPVVEARAIRDLSERRFPVSDVGLLEICQTLAGGRARLEQLTTHGLES